MTYELCIVLNDVDLNPIKELSVELTEDEVALLMPARTDLVGSILVQLVRRHRVGRVNLPVGGIR